MLTFLNGPQADIEIVDNTVCASSVLDWDMFGIWTSKRRPPRLLQKGNRENW
jgi:hypothetical protein